MPHAGWWAPPPWRLVSPEGELYVIEASKQNEASEQNEACEQNEASVHRARQARAE